MNGRELALSQYQFAHSVTRQVMTGLEPTALHAKLPGSSIDTIASTFAHLVFAEDGIVNGMALGAAPVYMRDGWGEKAGTPFPASSRQDHDWAATVTLDLEKFMPYADAVFANTEAVLRDATEEQLARDVQGPVGKSSALGLIGGLGLFHLTHHLGEISALLGAQGLKGLPF